jgi:CheY-like chemotaxis protein
MEPVGRLRALVIDSDVQSRAAVRAVLRDAYAPLDACDCADGPSALEILRGWDPDVILVDYALRPMDGLAFVRRVRAGYKTPHRDAPIVLITSHADLDHVAAARRAGVNAVVVRPFSAEALLKAVETAIGRDEASTPVDRRKAEPGRLAG